MKNKKVWGFIIALIAGSGITIYNGTGEPIVTADGKEFDLEVIELKKSMTKQFKDRDILDVMEINECTQDTTWTSSREWFIDVHCTATPQDYKVENVAIWHVDGNNWAGIGYAALIRNTGDLYLGNQVEKISYHNAGQNTHSIGIALIGDFDDYPVEDGAINTLTLLIDAFKQTIPIKGVRAHADNPNTTKSCPGEHAYKQLTDLGIFFNNNYAN